MKTVYRRIEFSILDGENAYLLPAGVEKKRVFQGIHIQSNAPVRMERAYIKNEPMPNDKINYYDEMILNPPDLDVFDWPEDLIMFHADNNELVYCLVYATVYAPPSKPFREIVFQPKDSTVLDWRNSYIKNLLLVFVRELNDFRNRGYLYIDYDIDHILFDEKNNKVYFGFSNYSINTKKKEKYIFDPTKLHPEFQSPYIYSSTFDGIFSFREDNYAISAILFYLMIGRLPYEGKGLYHHGIVLDPRFDTDCFYHDEYFRQYHRYPYFIFDRTDRRNDLGNVSINSLPKDRWNSLPNYIKRLFEFMLCQDLLLRGKGKTISPKEWIDVLTFLYQSHVSEML